MGDNLFFGRTFSIFLRKIQTQIKNTIFTYEVKNPEAYGVLQRSKHGAPTKIIEKPKKFISNEIVTGLYFYNNDVIELVKKLKPSKRGN